MNADEMKRHLSYQCDRLEALLAAYKAPGRVTGGTVGPRAIRLFFNPAPTVRFASIKKLADDMALALRVQSLEVTRGKDGIVLEYPNPNPSRVTLKKLLRDVMPLPVGAVLLGLGSDGSPITAHLRSPDVAHVLIAGTTGSGKSVLLRTMAGSAMLAHRPDAVQIAVADVKGRTFPKNFSAPHLLRPVIADWEVAARLLRSLVVLMEKRDADGVSFPIIEVYIDELADLLMLGDGIEDILQRLVQRGREAGIHIIAATQRPSAAVLSGAIRGNFPLRLVGRVVSGEDSRIAAGRGGINAHLLQGHGDFKAVGAGQIVHFQAAYSEPKELSAEFTTLDKPIFLELPDVDDEVEEDVKDEVNPAVLVLAPSLDAYLKSDAKRTKTAMIRHIFNNKNLRASGWHLSMLDQTLEYLGVEL